MRQATQISNHRLPQVKGKIAAKVVAKDYGNELLSGGF
jgi:hypothetical protein